MKKNKIISTIASAVMAISAIGTVPAGAADNYGMNELDKYYTLEELFAMSDEEFLALDGAEGMYKTIEADAKSYTKIFDIEEYGGISGVLIVDCIDNEEYVPNFTEKKIETLLGDTVNYEIDSPIVLDVETLLKEKLYYGNYMFVGFNDYVLSGELQEWTLDDIMKFTKCWYCVDQVFNIHYYGWGYTLSSAPGEKITAASGDANCDGTVDLYDAIWVAYDMIGVIDLTEGQIAMCDMTQDGKIDLYDAIKIAEKLL